MVFNLVLESFLTGSIFFSIDRLWTRLQVKNKALAGKLYGARSLEILGPVLLLGCTLPLMQEIMQEIMLSSLHFLFLVKWALFMMIISLMPVPSSLKPDSTS